MLQAQINRRRQSAPVRGARTQRGAISSFGRIGGARTLVRMIRDAALVQVYEVALMASVAAMLPLHLVGRGFGIEHVVVSRRDRPLGRGHRDCGRRTTFRLGCRERRHACGSGDLRASARDGGQEGSAGRTGQTPVRNCFTAVAEIGRAHD